MKQILDKVNIHTIISTETLSPHLSFNMCLPYAYHYPTTTHTGSLVHLTLSFITSCHKHHVHAESIQQEVPTIRCQIKSRTYIMNYIKPNPLKTISQTILEVTEVSVILVLVPTALSHTLTGTGDENLNMHKLKQNQTKHTTLINYLYHQMTPSYAA